MKKRQKRSKQRHSRKFAPDNTRGNRLHIRKITKVGGHSYAITLPVDVVRRWGWRERQNLTLEIDDDTQTITIKDWKK